MIVGNAFFMAMSLIKIVKKNYLQQHGQCFGMILTEHAIRQMKLTDILIMAVDVIG